MHRIRLIAALLLATTSLAHAGEERAGTTAANFLSVGQGASVLSMGGASLASAAGLDAAAWNPAALAGLGATQFTLAHASLASETSQEWAAMGGRFGQGRTRWALSALYQSDGSFEGRDAFNQPTGSFQVSDMAVGMQVARPFGERVTAGIGLKWVRESLGASSGSGLAFDAGLQSRSGPFGFGVAARQIGGSMSFDGASYDMPAVVGAGVSWAHPSNGLRLALDANLPSAYYNDVRAGAEWRWRDRVALRSGYRANLGAPEGEGLGGASFGLGLGANGFWFDYAFLAGDAEAQGRHRFGMTFHPGALASLGGRGPLGADAAAPAPAAAPRREPAAAPVAAAPAPSPAPAPKPAKSSPPPPAAAPAPAARAEAAAPARTVDDAAIARAANAAAPASAVADRAAPSGAPALAASRSVKVPRLIVPAPERAAKAPVAASPAPAATPPAAKPASVTAPAPVPVPAAAPVAAAPEPDVRTVATQAPIVRVVPRSPATPPGPRPASVEVQPGETLADLAKRWDTSVPRIMMENNLVTDRVKPGKRIKLPPAGSR